MKFFAARRTLVDNEETKSIDFRADLINELENIGDRLQGDTSIS